jgi:hypothetical protein
MAAKPVGVDELKDAILRMIVREFGDRPLTWEDASMALSLANFEIKQAALFAPRIAKACCKFCPERIAGDSDHAA